MKQLIIYYSYEGNTQLIAEKMAEATGADIMTLKPEREMKTKGFMKYVWGGRAAVMKKSPKLEPLTHNIDNYDQIILGTPVWAGTFTPPFNTLLSEVTIKNKSVALFCCHAGGKGRIFEHFKKRIPDNKFISELELINPLKGKTEQRIEEAITWIKSL